MRRRARPSTSTIVVSCSAFSVRAEIELYTRRIGATAGSRTPNLVLKRDLLCQLSYGGATSFRYILVVNDLYILRHEQ